MRRVGTLAFVMILLGSVCLPALRAADATQRMSFDDCKAVLWGTISLTPPPSAK